MYIKEPKAKFTKVKKEKQSRNYFVWCLFGFVCLLVYAGISEFEKFTEVDKNGKFQISEKRQYK